MGYSHYWTAPQGFTPKQWDELRAIVADFLESQFEAEIINGSEYENPRAVPPCVDEGAIIFNGSGETLWLDRHETRFQYCKTSQGLYDATVVAVLLCANYVNPLCAFSSDGNAEQLAAGTVLATQLIEQHRAQVKADAAAAGEFNHA